MRYEGRIRGARTCKEQLPVAADGESAPRFCVTCKRLTPPLTSHCDACGVCVAARDHHCGLFACCIGSRHPREFLVLLAATFVGIALTTADVVRAFCAERLPVIWAQLATPWREWTLSRGAAMLGDAAAAVLYVNMLAAIGLVAVICAVQQLAYAAAINDDVVAYLEETSCAKQTAESIAAFMKACEPFRLKRAEVLNLINEQPQTLVEIHLIVEECEERLSQDQTQQLLDTVAVLIAAGASRANGV